MGKKNLKTKKILVAVLFVGIFFMQGNLAIAQFNPQGGPASRFGQTDANGPIQNHWIRSIGIGNFTNNGDMTHAFLHVNSNYLLLPQNGSIANLGEVFRTDCPANQSTYWRMWRGFKSVGDIFSQYSLNDIENDNFSMQATVRDITFHTQPFDVNIIGEERMRIVGKEHSFEGIDILPGNVGIGTKHPTQKIDVVGNARIRQVPPGDFDRALVIDGDGVLHWRNFEGGGPDTSLGGNTQGFVGVGTDNPIAALHVANGDIAVTDDDSGIILKASNGDNYFRILVDDNGNLYTEQVNIK
ncbi:MAG: hypothetical protein PHW83_12760 [Bacteroidales bacterium]|nr:hypothetical protein [Bacteroidales bacterium]